MFHLSPSLSRNGFHHQGDSHGLVTSPASLHRRQRGEVQRLSSHMPPALSDPAAGVSCEDFSISAHVSARLFLPDHPTPADNHRRMLPIVVYFHGGGFSFESPFSTFYHRYISTLASQVRVLAVSVKYRLAPENPLPAAYEDSWAALQWVCSHSAGISTLIGKSHG